MAQVDPSNRGPLAVKGLYREKRFWVEADFLDQTARESAWFRGESASFCEHFESRPQSGEKEALVAKRGHPLQEAYNGQQGDRIGSVALPGFPQPADYHITLCTVSPQ